MKYPNITAKTKAKYFKCVTSETSENLYDWLSQRLAAPPNIPIKDNYTSSEVFNYNRKLNEDYTSNYNEGLLNNIESKINNMKRIIRLCILDF